MEDAIFVCVRRILSGDKRPQTILDALIANHREEWQAKIDQGIDVEYCKRRYIPQALRWAAFIRASLKDDATNMWARHAIMNEVHPTASPEWLEKETHLKTVEVPPKVVKVAPKETVESETENDLPISPDVSDEHCYREALLIEGPYSAKAYYYGLRCAQSVPITIGA